MEDIKDLLTDALDVIVADRVSRGLPVDRAWVTAARDLLEQRTLTALTSYDPASMPKEWSWRRAAKGISVQIALAMVADERDSRRLGAEGA